MQVEIIDLSAEHKSAWEKLYYGYADFYQVPMNDEIIETVWNWIQEPSQAFYAVAAKIDENLVGFMHFRAMPSPLRGAMVGFLDDLYVTSEARGQGVVDALFASLSERGKALGWPIIRWITAEDNHRARQVYDRISQQTHWVTYQLELVSA